MAVSQPESHPPPRLATNDHLFGQSLRDPDSHYVMKVVGICDKGVFVVKGNTRRDLWGETAIVWGDKQINRALLKTFQQRKVRRA